MNLPHPTPQRLLARAAVSARPTVSALHVVERRARADRPAVAAYTLLAVLVTLGALQAPLAFERAADAGLRRAVTDAGRSADVVVTGPFQLAALAPAATADDAHPVSPLAGVIGAVMHKVPRGVRDVLRQRIAVVHGQPLVIATPTGPSAISPLVATGERVRWVDGTAPGDPVTFSAKDVLRVPTPASMAGDPGRELPDVAIPLGISAAAAKALGLHVGDLLADRSHDTVVRVAGIFEPTDTRDPFWASTPDLLATRKTDSGNTVGAALLSASGMAQLVTGGQAAGVEVRAPADIAALRSSSVDDLRDAVDLLGEGSLTVDSHGIVDAEVSTRLGAVLDRYAVRHDVAAAQATTVLTGLAVLAAVVINQAAGMIVARRRTVLGLERARGSSILAVVVRAALESLPVALVALLVAALSTLPFGGPPAGANLIPVVVTLTATTAAPALHAAGVARGAWSGRRVAANRRARAKAARVRGSWRTAGEATVVALAVAAVTATAVRGLGVGGDLLVAAAPVLAALGCTLLLARLMPAVMRSVTRAASRRGSVVTLVGLSRTGRRGATGIATVLLVVTTATALAVYGGAAAATVAAAPVAAAHVRVGSDARIDNPSPALVAAALKPHPGVTATLGTVLEERPFLGGAGPYVTVLAVDPAAFPQFRKLAAASRSGLPKPGGAVPALVEGSLSHTVTLVPPTMWAVDEDVALDVVGTVDLATTGPSLQAEDDSTAPRIVVDRAALAAATGADPSPASKALQPEVIWLTGPAAGSFAAGLKAQELGGTVTTRDGVIHDLRTDPLPQGVTDLLRATTWLVAVLALIAVVLALAGGGAERTRVLAVLRTLGVRRTAARGLTLTEFAPAAAVALVAGCGVGIVLAYTLVGGLELGTLEGGSSTPPVLLSWWPFAVAAGAVLAALTIGTVLASRAARHVRVGEVLRTW